MTPDEQTHQLLQDERLTADLHDDVEGKVEQQVADGDGEEVRGEVVGPLDESVRGSVERTLTLQSCSFTTKHTERGLLTETSSRCSPAPAAPSGPEPEEPTLD